MTDNMNTDDNDEIMQTIATLTVQYGNASYECGELKQAEGSAYLDAVRLRGLARRRLLKFISKHVSRQSEKPAN